MSVIGFGSDCDFIFSKDMSSTVIGTKVVTNMTVAERYTVTVTASATDGRYASADITVVPTTAGAAVIQVTSLAKKFNRPSALQLFARIQSSSAQMATWSLNGDSRGFDLDPVSLTQTTKNFTAFEGLIGIAFPFSIGPNVFTPGRSYTFRLTSVTINNTREFGFGEISLDCNAPPSNGVVKVRPPNGTAVLTKFIIQADNWYDADYPLYYTFKYTLQSSIGNSTGITSDTANGGFYSIMAKSEKKFAESNLPNGLPSLEYRVTCVGEVSDSLGASSYDSRLVSVYPVSQTGGDVALELASTLTDSMGAAFASGNLDSVVQTVNVIASTIGQVSAKPVVNQY